MRRILIALVGALLLAGCSTQSSSPERLPDLTLPGLRADEPEVRLSELKGPALINVWASYCAPCKTELPIIAEYAKKHPEIKVLGIDYTDPDVAKARELADRSSATFAMVRDSDGQLPVKFLPQFVMLKADGTVAWRGYVAVTSLSQLEALVKEHLS